MRSVPGPAAPLVVSLSLVTALGACSAEQNDGPSGDLGTTTSLVSSSTPTGSDVGGQSGQPGRVPVGESDPQPARGAVEIVDAFAHDPGLFTQGLQVHDGQIYESTGRYGSSEVQRRPLREVDPTVRVEMAPDEFGEGLAVTPDTLWTLTWREGIAHNRDPRTLEVRSQVPYEGEGWGLCFNGAQLVMSDGSDELTFRDPVTFEPTDTVSVTAGGTPVRQLNELECGDGTVLANVWMTDEIVRIDPSTGAVTAIYDASELEQPRPGDPDAVLNGIAALPDSDTVLLTGKLWSQMYEVRLVE